MQLKNVLLTTALLGCSFAHAIPRLVEMQTQGAQIFKLSENGRYAAATVSGDAFASRQALLWSLDENAETLVAAFDAGNGVNNVGTLVGSVPMSGGPDVGGQDYAALLPLGASTPSFLPPEPGASANSVVNDISDDGVAVGTYWTADLAVYKAVMWSKGQPMTDLPVEDQTVYSRANKVSADGGTVVGYVFSTGTFPHAAVWREQQLTVLSNSDGHPLGEAQGLSGNGRFVVGSNYETAVPGMPTAWRWDARTGEVIALPNMLFALAVSNDGRIVTGNIGVDTRVSVVWIEGHGTITLRDYMTERGIARPAGWTKLVGALDALSGDGSLLGGCCLPPESLPFGRSFVLAGLNDAPDRLFSDGLEGALIENPVHDPSFEASTATTGPNPFWSSSDSNPDATQGATVFFNESEVRGATAQTGLWLAMFGGYFNGDEEAQDISQAVLFPKGDHLFLHYGRFAAVLPESGAFLQVMIDAQVVETTDLTKLAEADADFTTKTIDVSAFADGHEHTIRFAYSYQGGSDNDGIVFLDDIEIDNRR